ncbi:alpha-L-fucosidase [Nonomuraea sp. SMC257]|uniref:alpha-L-fucosidase n=1 Tax=Nonomuraea montanisoli TaxID=2741721 RepID=A0A7Y6M4C2_9ACTN|nr:alpha-L-fucosidase [Nonomuraea montanisoli]NUW33350.1 alpha-L-fucosidase [Nonomuraea montanisoli]
MPPTKLSALRRRTALAGVPLLAGALLTAPALTGTATAAPAVYEPTWASVDQHPAAPEWFQDAKFGIYFHWGAFATPAFGSEWYPRNMYVGGSAENNHHRNVYGDPAAWPYHNFIDGARDKAGNRVQFAPKLKSAGGTFDPDEWAQLFADSGARFAGPVAEHHDGFSMWDSQVNEWNSVGRGPKLDLLRIFADAIRAKNMKLLVAMHHAYNFTGYYDRVPAQPTTSLKKLYGQLGPAAQNQLWYDKLKEVVDKARPDILWQDFNLSRVDESRRLDFLSYYYNQANAWGKEVVATYKDGFTNKGEVFDYERGGPADIQYPYWLTDDAISSSSWSYTNGIGYYSAPAMLHSLIDRVSKNGNMLLNVSPMIDGTIPQGQRDILHAIGTHLRRNGESIYSTRAWTVYGEGPTKMGGGSFTTPRPGTAKDIRYTRSKDNTVLYATVLGWPGNGATLDLASLASGRVDLSNLSRTELIGDAAGTYIDLPTRAQDAGGLHITLPGQPYSALAYVVKLTFNGPIKVPSGANGALRNVNAGRCLDVPSLSQTNGTQVALWDCNGQSNQQWTSTSSGELRVYGGKCLDVNGAGTADGTAVIIWDCNGQNNQKWRLNADGTITAVGANKCLDVAGAGTANGTKVQIWTCHGGANQKWTRP